MNEVDSRGVNMLRVFVVENHRDTLTYLTMYLESLGYTVASACTVETAREAMGRSIYDVLVSDIGLPDGDGWELLRRVRAISPHPVFAIAMSGFGSNVDHVRSRDAGYRHHLLKPFEPEKLAAMLEAAAHELTAPV